MTGTEPYLITGLISAAGAYSAVWVHIKFVTWRLDQYHSRIDRLEEGYNYHSEKLAELRIK